jgi:hypothetical protein
VGSEQFAAAKEGSGDCHRRQSDCRVMCDGDTPHDVTMLREHVVMTAGLSVMKQRQAVTINSTDRAGGGL